ncbi:MAG: radical SAM protein [Candidatus Omnitrophica bacterium]|nr:radical SAM protein [Candidatus Omnitrophota bacterium]
MSATSKTTPTFKYIYGPVASWRLGSSLGIDLLSGKLKRCCLDCRYCQLGPKKPSPTQRKVYVPTAKLIQEIKALPRVRIDYITFSGSGEPTLASNLGECIKQIKKLRPEPIAVLTNSCLLYRKDVRRELSSADLVVAKLDVPSGAWLKLFNRPAGSVRFPQIFSGIRKLRREYPGRLAIQIMFTAQNLSQGPAIAKLVKDIRPDQVQICTPTRSATLKPLTRKDVFKIKKYFRGLGVLTLYDVRPKPVKPLSKKATQVRRPD